MASKRITDFKPHKANANKGSERGEYMIEASLREVGAWRSVGADRNGTIGVGNKTTQKWQEIANPDDVIVVHTTGDKLVVVQRDDLDFDSDDPAVVERTVKAAYYDNRAGEVSMTWDAEQVLADLTAGVDLSAMFRQDELDGIIGDLVGASDAALDGFGDFGGASADDGFIAFKFGDYSGRVSKVVYDSFVAAYKEQQQESGEPMLDDVLRGWLCV